MPEEIRAGQYPQNLVWDWLEADPENAAAWLSSDPAFRKALEDRQRGQFFRNEYILKPWLEKDAIAAANFAASMPALASYARAFARHGDILGEVVPMIIGTRLRSRGTHAFYRVRIPVATRAAAIDICARLQKAGGACVVLKS